MVVFGVVQAEFAPGGVDRTFWSESSAKSSREFERNKSDAHRGVETLRLLLVGNLNTTKGIDIFLTALMGVERPLEVRVVGSELSTHQNYARMLYQSAKDLSALNPRLTIEFLGWQDPAAVRELLANCDAFVLPSRSEACPLVLLEALAMGCLCVASDVGDVRLMLGGDARHRIFQPGAVEELRDILQTLESPPLPPRLNSSFIDEWNLERVAAKISAIYDELRKPPPKSM
jgi:glycosyltransferase involved in cell wall biosynthesis